MPFSASSVYSLIPDDVDFSRRQLDAANLQIVSYNVSGQPIYGYFDNNNTVHELGTLGSFNALDKSLYINVSKVSSSREPLGLRTYSGVYNNLKPGRETWGATNEAFLRLTNANYSNYLGQNISNTAYNPGRFGSGTQGFQDAFQTAANGQTISNGIASSSNLYADPFKTVVDYTPRMISQTISSQTALERLGIGEYDSLTNLIRNGSFEDKQYATQAGWFETNLNGWKSSLSSSIEVQNLSAVYGSTVQGNNWIELDAFNKNIQQDVQTEAGKSYKLSFSYGARPGVGLANSKVQVYWNGQLLDTLNENGIGQTKTQWKSYTYEVLGSGNGTSGLEFRSVDNPTGLGSYIDNVKLIDANEVKFIPSSRSNDSNNQPRSGGSGIFTLFGQYFDHGLDFIEKGGNIGANGQSAKLVIPLSPSDPLYDPAKGVTSITVSRANVANPLSAGPDGKFRTADDINPGADGKYGTSDDSVGPVNPAYINRTSAYADLSQAYGSDQQISELLREWVADPNNSGKYLAGAKLLSGYTLEKPYEFVQADGSSTLTRETVPTLRELRVHLAATGRDDLTWDDIQNYRARDSQGHVLDADPNQPGIQAIRTNQAILLDANPHFDAARIYQNGTSPDTTGVLAGVILSSTLDSRGLPTTITVGGVQNSLSKYINVNTFAIQPNLSNSDQAIANELLLRSVSDHYIAGDGRLNENFGLTTMHHVFHQSHLYHLNTLESLILKQQSANPDTDPAHFWQVEVKSKNGATLATGVSVVNGHYEDAKGNYVTTDGSISWNQDKLFEAARLITQTEYQHITVEYANFVSPDIPKFKSYNDDLNAGVSLEYAQAAFRFGHSQLRETIDILDPNGSLTASVQKFALKSAFLNPQGFAELGPAGIAMGMARQVSGEIDEFITPALQQSLLGQPLDLAAINIIRGRDLGLPTLNETRKQLRDSLAAEKAAGSSVHSTLKAESLNPYTSWSDFRNNMIHPESIANFMAAYSFDGDVSKGEAIVGLVDGKINQGSVAAKGFTLAQAQSFFSGGDQGFQKIDLWIGGLAEKHVSGGQLGSTFNVIFVDQMERSQDGDRFYYLHRIDSEFQEARGIFSEIEVEQFKDLLERTTGARHLQGDVFEHVSNHIELSEKAISSPGSEHKYGGITAVSQLGLGVRSVDGTDTNSNGTIVTFNGQTYLLDTRPSKGKDSNGSISEGYNSSEVIGGTNNNDYIEAGGGNNTIYGEGGNDILVGGNSTDYFYGGAGNDNLNGSTGDDVLNGGVGDDVIYGGDGSDILVGESGNDTLHGEAGDDDIMAGYGNDVIFVGSGNDRVFGGEGYDTAYVSNDSLLYKISSSTDSKWVFKIDGGEEKAFVDVDRIEFSNLQGKFDAYTGGGSNDRLTASTNQSLLAGGDGDDTLIGGSNDDHFQGGRGNDQFVGTGTGNDTVYYDKSAGNYQLSISNGNLQITDTAGDDGSDTLIGIERIRFSSRNATTKVITYEDFRTVTGTTGNDNFNATNDVAFFDGGSGVDTFTTDYSNSVNVNLTSGTVFFTGKPGSIALANIENVVTGNGNDVLVGNAANNLFMGRNGNDTISGGDGSDTLVYNAGTDTNNYQFSLADLQGRWTITSSGNSLGIDTFDGIEQINYDVNPGSLLFQVLTGSKVNDSFTATNTASIINGGIGNDQLKGGTSNDHLAGGLGDDILDGGAGNNDTAYYYGAVGDYQVGYDTAGNLLVTDKAVVNGDEGTDQLTNIETLNFAGTNFKVLNGTAGNDNLTAINTASILLGGNGADTLTGGTFNDLLLGGAGNDTLNGGAGSDVAYFAGNVADYQFVYDVAGNLVVTDKVIANGDDGVDRLTNIESLSFAGNNFAIINGTAGSDNITATSAASIMFGNNGNDNITGGAANDLLFGGNGSDTLNGGGGDDVAYYAGNIADYLFSKDADGNALVVDLNVTDGDEGTDRLTNIEVLKFADAEARIVNGVVVRDSLILGGDGNDFLQGGVGSDTIDGGKGDDILIGNDGNDSLQGGVGNDSLQGGGGDDRLEGGDGNDLLDGGFGFDTITGGAGNDTVTYSYWNGGINYDINTGVVQFGGNSGSELAYEIENVIGSTGNDTIIGSQVANALDGNNGDDFILGGGGNDALSGGNGQDTLVGDDGNDFLQGGAAADALYGGNDQDTLVGDDGNDYLQGGWGNDALSGGNDQDILDGDIGNDFLQGGAGNDSLYGANDQDTLVGDDGNDYLQGGAGADALYGGNDQDILVGDDGNDYLQGGWGDDSLSGGNDQDILDGDIGNDFLQGGAGNDSLYGANGLDTLVGDDGNDFLQGGVGADALYGGNDQDTLVGDDSDDYLQGGWGDDYLYGGNDRDILDGDNGNDYLQGGWGDDYLYGGNGQDTLIGDLGWDYLNGGDGNDILTGGGGDTLVGGAGQDVFAILAPLKSVAEPATLVSDLAIGVDKISLSRSSFSALASLVGSGLSVASEFAVVNNAAAVDISNALIVYNTTDNTLTYNANGALAGLGSGGVFAKFENAVTISKNDFQITE